MDVRSLKPEELGKTDNAPLPLKKIERQPHEVTAEGTRLLQYVATRVTPVRDYTGFSHPSSTKCKTCPSYGLEPYPTIIFVRNSL